MTGFAAFRHTIAARLVMLVVVMVIPLLGLPIYYAVDETKTARDEALVRSQQVANTLLSRIENHVRSADSLLLAVAATVPLRPDSLDLWNAKLRKIKAGFPEYIGSISVLELDGNMLYSAEENPPAPGSLNLGDREYFKKALTSDGLVISSPLVSRTSGKWILVLARAVRDEPGGPVRGVVTTSIRLDQFQFVFVEDRLPSGSLIMMIDQNGTVLGSSLEPEKWIGKSLASDATLSRVLRDSQAEAVRELALVDQVKRFSAISSSSWLGWRILAGIPSEIALAAGREHMLRVVLLALLVSALALAVASGIARSIANPLRRLARDASEFASGDRSHRTKVTARGEVGALASSFNAMARDVERQSAKLHENEQQFRATFEQAAVGIAHFALDGHYLNVNQRLCELVGYTRDQMLTRRIQDLTHPDDVAIDETHMQQLRQGSIATCSSEKRYIHSSGSSVWANLTLSLVRRKSGEPDYFISVIEDIGERKRTELLIDGQKQVLEMMASGATLHETLTSLLMVIEAQAEGMLTSVLLLDADGTHLQHGSAPNLPPEFMRAIDGSPIGAHAGSCGTAAFLKKEVMVEDISTDPLWVDYRELASNHGLRACWSTPIFGAEDRVLGTFAIYYRMPCLPSQQHLELIRIATHTAAIAIRREQSEVERERLLTEVEAARRDAVATRDLLSSVFVRMNDGIVALDREWHYTYVNDKAAELLNRGKATDLIGKYIWDEYPEGIDQPFGQSYRQAMESQQAVYLEEHYAPWDRWFENRIYPSADGLTVYFTEITKRKHAEQALRNERALLQQVTSCSPVGILVADRKGRITFANQTAQETLGLTRDEMGQSTYDAPAWKVLNFDRSAVPSDQQPFARVMRGCKPVFNAEHLVEWPDGRSMMLSVNAAALLDADGEMEGVVMAVSDITERRKVTEALRASEEKFATAFRSSPDAITITSAEDGRIVEVNEAGARAIGFAREDLIGRLGSELSLWANEEDRDRYVGLLREQGRVTNMEAPFRGKSGEIRIGLVSGELIQLEGRPHILGVIRDITAAKHAEEEIRTLNAELEQRVAERTAQLEAANKELEAFSYSVSHDLKAPLRGIDGYSQLLEADYGESMGEEARVFLHNIRHGAAQMHELIEDLLAYSRMERRSLENTSLDLAACVNAIVVGYTQALEERRVVLHLDVPALTVHVDRDGLAIVLRNLFDNALKFSRDSNPPTIEIGARKEGGKVTLWVRDNGIGFDMKFHDRIFEIFSRLQRSEDYPGTGVGLALVRRAMLRMGGRVWAESAKGQGSTFFLEMMA